MMKRVLALLLSVSLLVGCLPTAAFAADGDSANIGEEIYETPLTEVEPTSTPGPTEEAESTPTPVPTEEPAEEADPTPTPEPTLEPTPTPVPCGCVEGSSAPAYPQPNLEAPVQIELNSAEAADPDASGFAVIAGYYPAAQQQGLLTAELTPLVQPEELLHTPEKIALETGAAAGSFFVRNNEEKYLQLASGEAGLAFVWAEKAGAASVLLYRAVEQAADGPLPGYALITETAGGLLPAEEPILMATLWEGQLYWMAADGTAVPQESKITVTLYIPEELDEAQQAQLEQLMAGEAVELTVGGVVCSVTLQLPDVPTPQNEPETFTLDCSYDDDSKRSVELALTYEEWKAFETIKNNNAAVSEFLRLETVKDSALATWTSSGEGYTTASAETLKDCLFTFAQSGDGYKVQAKAVNTGEAVYLDLTDQGCPTKGTENANGATIKVVVNESDATVALSQSIAETETTLRYSIWDFFTDSVKGQTTNDNRPTAPIKGSGCKIYLYHAEQHGEDGYFYTRVTTQEGVQNGKQYLIVALVSYVNGSTQWRVLRPYASSNSDDRNAFAAKIVNGDPAYNAKIIGLRDGSAELTFGQRTYHITVTHAGHTATMPGAVDREIGLVVGQSQTLLRVPGYYTSSDALSGLNQNIASVKFENPVQNSIESYANHHNGSGQGWPSKYCGTQTPVSSCLWTFTEAGDSYEITIQNDSGKTLYVKSPVNQIPATTAKRTMKITSPRAGIFYLQDTTSNEYLAFRRNGWGIFYNKANPASTNSTPDGATKLANENGTECELRIYRPMQQGDAAADTQEMPGYVRVFDLSEIQSRQQYLIAAQLDFQPQNSANAELEGQKGNYIYLLHPCYDVSPKSNSFVVMANKTYDGAHTDFVFTAKNTTGTTTVQIGGKNYTVHVWDKFDWTAAGNGHIASMKGDDILSQVTPAKGDPIHKLTISAGTSYTVSAANAGAAKYWISENANAVTVENGVIQAISNGDTPFVRTYVGYVDANNKIHAFEVVVINTFFTESVRLYNYYTAKVENTIPYYTWCEESRTTEYTTGDYKQMEEKEVLYLTLDVSQNYGIHFFAKASAEQYALVQLGASNSSGIYKKIMATSAVDTEYYKAWQGSAQDRLFTSFKSMIQHAMDDVGCTGAMGFTLFADNTASYESSLTFRSIVLPQVSKKVLAVFTKPTTDGATKSYVPYTDGMEVHEGDEVHYMITLEKEPNGAGEITYTDTVLKDSLKGANLVGYSITLGSNPEKIIEVTRNADESGYTYAYQATLADKFDDGVVNREGPAPASESGAVLEGEKLAISALAEGGFSIKLADVLQSYCTDKVVIKLYVSYTVTAADCANITQGKYLENVAELSNSFKAKFDGDDGSRVQNASARAILRIGMTNYLKYINLSLDGTLRMNFYLTAPNADSEWNQRNYVVLEVMDFADPSKVYKTDSNSKETLILEDGTPRTTRVVTRFADGAAATIGTGEGSTACKMFSVELGPQEMASYIKVYLQNADGDRASEVKVVRLCDYAQKLLSLEEKDKLIGSWQVNGKGSFSYSVNKYEDLQKMLAAMLRYGAAVQKYMGYNTKHLASTAVTGDIGPQWTDATKEALKSAAICVQGNTGDIGIEFTGLALQLNSGSSGIGVRVYFKLKPTRGQPEDAIAALRAYSEYVKQQNGTYYLYGFENGIHTDKDGYYVLLNNITAAWMGNTYRVTILDDGVDEAVRRGCWVELNAVTYAKLVLCAGWTPEQLGGKKDALEEMAKTMYLYNSAAEAYFLDKHGTAV